MGMNKELSTDLKQTIMNLVLWGYSLRKTAQLIYKTVQYIVDKFKYQVFVKNLQWKPKQKTLNEKEEKHIVREVKRNPRINTPKLSQLAQSTTGKNIFN